MKTIKDLCELLIELSELESSFFKSRAYKNAVLSLNHLSDDDFMTRDDFTDLDGIGSGINSKIIEYKLTGSISKLVALRQENSNYLDSSLYKIRKSFITKRIPFNLATEYVNKLTNELKGIELHVAGSYRRKKALIGDIDILIDYRDYYKVINILNQNYEVISSGDYKSSYLIDKVNNIQLDIISTTPDDFPFQLLYLTGSKEFNIKMRARAKSLGYRLNQEGLYNTLKDCWVQDVRTEEDIFRYVNMVYTVPEYR